MIDTEEKRLAGIQRSRQWYRENSERAKARQKIWRDTHPERCWTQKSGINFTAEDYNAMFAEQEGCCKLCGIHQSELKKRLHVDHNHSTGRIRGLLCQQCNHALGLLKDSLDTARILVVYLEEDQ